MEKSSKKLNIRRRALLHYDYSKLSGRIVEICGTQAEFAKRMGLSERTVSLKMNNKVPWKQQEIELACEELDIRPEEIQVYFFTKGRG